MYIHCIVYSEGNNSFERLIINYLVRAASYFFFSLPVYYIRLTAFLSDNLTALSDTPPLAVRVFDVLYFIWPRRLSAPRGHSLRSRVLPQPRGLGFVLATDSKSTPDLRYVYVYVRALVIFQLRPPFLNRLDSVQTVRSDANWPVLFEINKPHKNKI